MKEQRAHDERAALRGIDRRFPEGLSMHIGFGRSQATEAV
jgi:hypothetical protein